MAAMVAAVAVVIEEGSLCTYCALYLEHLSAPATCPVPPTVGVQTTEGTQPLPCVVLLGQEIPKLPPREPGNRTALSGISSLLCSPRGVSENTQASLTHGASASFHLPEIPHRLFTKWLISWEAITVATSLSR